MEDKHYYKKSSYYESLEFRAKLSGLMIPDAAQFVSNIFYSLRCAEQSRLIIYDITESISEWKIANKKFINSKEYKVGGISVDAREFIQRHMREWCEYISKVNDSLAQIINITLELGCDPKRVTPKKIQDNKIVITSKSLNEKYCDLRDMIAIIQALNNFSKHTFNLWSKELFNINEFKDSNYYILHDGERIFLKDMITSSNETKIRKQVIEILDIIFLENNIREHENRIYIKESEYRENQGVSNVSSLVNISPNRFLDINLQVDMEESVKPVVYLATYFRDDRRSFISVTNSIIEKIDIYKNDVQAGLYQRESKKRQLPFLEFTKYIFVPN